MFNRTKEKLTPNERLIKILNSLDWQYIVRNQDGLQRANLTPIIQNDILLAMMLQSKTFTLDGYTYRFQIDNVERIGPKIPQPQKKIKPWIVKRF